MGPAKVPIEGLRVLSVDLRADQSPDLVLKLGRAGQQQVVDVDREEQPEIPMVVTRGPRVDRGESDQLKMLIAMVLPKGTCIGVSV